MQRAEMRCLIIQRPALAGTPQNTKKYWNIVGVHLLLGFVGNWLEIIHLKEKEMDNWYKMARSDVICSFWLNT